MTWSKAIYPPLHDLLFLHQLSGGQIKSLVGELELKKVVDQDPKALKNDLHRRTFEIVRENVATF